MKVGRKAIIDQELLKKVLHDHESAIIDPVSKKCVSKLNPIWDDICKKLNNSIKLTTLYVYACRIFNIHNEDSSTLANPVSNFLDMKLALSVE